MGTYSGSGELTRHDCLVKLASGRFGRIAVSLQSLPTILPVAYAMDDDEIVVTTTARPPVLSAVYNNVVTFQVDDAEGRSGDRWSVMVTGIARPFLPFVPAKADWSSPPVALRARIPVTLMQGIRLVGCHLDPIPSD
jgi:hypothetical protein